MRVSTTMEEDKSTFVVKPSTSIKEHLDQHDNETAETLQNTKVIAISNEITSNKPVNAAESCIVAQEAPSTTWFSLTAFSR